MRTDWIPFELTPVGQRSMVRWVHPGTGTRFLAPFFTQSVQAMLDAHAPQKLTPLSALSEFETVNSPSAFIFHVARCGSTLVSRSLAEVARHRVISEPNCVNQLLLAREIGQEEKKRLLKGLIHALCGSAADTRCIFKFSSWNLFFLQQIRSLFPATPCVFLYREPAAVMASFIAGPPRWASNPDLAVLIGNPHGEGVASMMFSLEKLFDAPWMPFNTDRSGTMRAFNYAQLPDAMLDITAHLGLALTPGEQAQVKRMGQFDAKRAGEIGFVARGRAALPAQLQPGMAPLTRLYAQWEQFRSSAPQRHALDGIDINGIDIDGSDIK